MVEVKKPKNKIKYLIIIQTIVLIISVFINISLYFYYFTTKDIIESILNKSKEIYNLKSIILLSNINIGKVFNNRELAIGFWTIIFIIFALSISSVRKQLQSLIKTMFNRKLILWYISMVLYVFGMVFVLFQIGFWKVSLLKETIFWFLFVGILLSFRAVDKAKDSQYFVNLIKDNIKVIIVVQFISNLYSFSFIWEVIVVFIAIFTSLLIAIVDTMPDFQNKNGKILKNIFNFILVGLGLIILSHSIKTLVSNTDKIIIPDLINELLLPPTLSLMFIFYAYLLAVIASYELIFIRLQFNKTIDDRYRFFLKLRIIIFCNLNLVRVKNFIQRSKIMTSNVRSRADIKQLFLNYKANDK
ncbi:hypothetical protein [Mesobacillus zeae]|uniref:Uncharacterized protein n=1 Tax=Mesobacillus zeae TaxID=1917180 RepID=A0A398AV30_9BACI|nr:hypothetical protein [Mesobacillus zeae]RID81545.1 hypothetical protein D1970_21515 [Mesobacillus zeae]